MDEKSDTSITLEKVAERVDEWGLEMCGILDIKVDTLDLREAFKFLNGDETAQHFSDHRVRKAFSHYPCNWAWTKKTELSRKIGSAVMVCLFDHQSMDVSIDDNNKAKIAFTDKEPSEYRELKKIAEGAE